MIYIPILRTEDFADAICKGTGRDFGDNYAGFCLRDTVRDIADRGRDPREVIDVGDGDYAALCRTPIRKD